MSEIRAAYRSRIKDFHPDTGAHDQEMLDRIAVAYEVLSDPGTRRLYDKLGRSEVWLDRLIREALEDRALKQAQRNADSREVQDILDALGLEMRSSENSYGLSEDRRDTEEPLSGFRYFTYADEDFVVDDPYPWIVRVAHEFWFRRRVVPVLVGFSDHYAIEDEGWGVVLFVPRDAQPNPFVLAFLIEQALARS